MSELARAHRDYVRAVDNRDSALMTAGGELDLLRSAQISRLPQRVWDPERKSFALLIDGGPRSSRLELTASGATHRFLVLELLVPPSVAFSFDVVFTAWLGDPRSPSAATARRLTLSTVYSKPVGASALSCKMPIGSISRGEWCSLTLDLDKTSRECFGADGFGRLERISVGSCCKLKRVYLRRERPPPPSADGVRAALPAYDALGSVDAADVERPPPTRPRIAGRPSTAESSRVSAGASLAVDASDAGAQRRQQRTLDLTPRRPQRSRPLSSRGSSQSGATVVDGVPAQPRGTARARDVDLRAQTVPAAAAADEAQQLSPAARTDLAASVRTAAPGLPPDTSAALTRRLDAPEETGDSPLPLVSAARTRRQDAADEALDSSPPEASLPLVLQRDAADTAPEPSPPLAVDGELAAEAAAADSRESEGESEGESEDGELVGTRASLNDELLPAAARAALAYAGEDGYGWEQVLEAALAAAHHARAARTSESAEVAQSGATDTCAEPDQAGSAGSAGGGEDDVVGEVAQAEAEADAAPLAFSVEMRAAIATETQSQVDAQHLRDVADAHVGLRAADAEAASTIEPRVPVFDDYDSEDDCIDLTFDPVRGCYVDPETGRCYELNL